MELASKKIKNHTAFSSDGMAELETFHGRIVANLDLAMNAFASGDLALARQLLRPKPQARQLERTLTERHFARLGASRPAPMIPSTLHPHVRPAPCHFKTHPPHTAPSTPHPD